MPLPAGLKSVAGAQELYDWFGYWPSFHDAEVISLHLNRKGSSSLFVYTWHTSTRTDARGCFEFDNEVVVEFIFDDLSEISLDGFSDQNVIFGLDVDNIESGFRLTLSPCWGLSGTIHARSVAIRLSPGAPSS